MCKNDIKIPSFLFSIKENVNKSDAFFLYKRCQTTGGFVEELYDHMGIRGNEQRVSKEIVLRR